MSDNFVRFSSGFIRLHLRCLSIGYITFAFCYPSIKYYHVARWRMHHSDNIAGRNLNSLLHHFATKLINRSNPGNLNGCWVNLKWTYLIKRKPTATIWDDDSIGHQKRNWKLWNNFFLNVSAFARFLYKRFCVYILIFHLRFR